MLACGPSCRQGSEVGLFGYKYDHSAFEFLSAVAEDLFFVRGECEMLDQHRYGLDATVTHQLVRPFDIEFERDNRHRTLLAARASPR